MSETLTLFSPQTLQGLTLSLLERLVKISALLEERKVSKEVKVVLSTKQLPSLLGSDQVFLSGKMLKEFSPLTLAQTFGQFSKNTSWVQAQNRERIFLVGYLAGRGEPRIFPFTEDDFLSKSGEESKSQAPISGTLKANGNLNQDDTYIVYGSTLKKHNKDYTNSKIRVLTEVERERLQGFPDNWTQYGDYGGIVKPISRRQRYKLIGNAVTVDIVEMIAKRLKITKQ